MFTFESFNRSITNQPPQSALIIDIFEDLRVGARLYAQYIFDLVPECPERTIALRKLEESVHYAVKAIALNQDAAEGHGD